ncbi:MAG TPA: hypothetical protein VGH40_20080 [Roseiarcus sp.]|jgi:hypothetical protein
MRRITTGAVVAYACLVAASASAEPLRHNEGHVGGEFGVGGWTPNYGARPYASGAITAVKAEVTGARPAGFGETDFDRRLRRFDADADCLFPPAGAGYGRLWRNGCK